MSIRYHRTAGCRAAPLIVAVALAILPLTSSLGRADDVGNDLDTAGQSIKKAAQDTGTAIGNGAKDVGNAVESKGNEAVSATKQGAATAGDKVEQGAQETGNFFERSANKVRTETGAFFKRVGEFFAGP